MCLALSGPPQELASVHLECVGKCVEVAQGHVALAALHRPDVRPVKAGVVRQRLLRQVRCQPALTHPAPERQQALAQKIISLPAQSAIRSRCIF